MDDESAGSDHSVMPESQQKKQGSSANRTPGKNKPRSYIEALGGKDNIKRVESCITRLRLELEDTAKIDEKTLKNLGATGVLTANENNAQVVVGTKAEMIADDIKKELKIMQQE